jgi:hypothetical protein
LKAERLKEERLKVERVKEKRRMTPRLLGWEEQVSAHTDGAGDHRSGGEAAAWQVKIAPVRLPAGCWPDPSALHVDAENLYQ